MSTFTSKHYEKIASIMRYALVEHQSEMSLDGVVRLLATEFDKDNPRFDYDRFIAACYGRSTKTKREQLAS